MDVVVFSTSSMDAGGIKEVYAVDAGGINTRVSLHSVNILWSVINFEVRRSGLSLDRGEGQINNGAKFSL